ncbi:MAG: YraN family protein [Fibrobacterota bacterium]
MNTRDIGHRGEEQAVEYLLRRGYAIWCRNWAYSWGEIDIIAESRRKELVFVEVKKYRSTRRGTGEDKITRAKLQNIQRLAECYISERPQTQNCPARIDVITITETAIRHYKNCFPL